MIRPFTPEDLPAIHSLLTSGSWDFYVDQTITAKELEKKGEKYFFSDTNKTLVYTDTDSVVLGYIRFFDIENLDTSSPLFDVRISDSARGKGIGTELVKTGVKYIFDTFENVRRIEGTTREDNIAMQKVFKAAGFTQEAKYRKSWRVKEGEYVDSIGYGILREEFKYLLAVWDDVGTSIRKTAPVIEVWGG